MLYRSQKNTPNVIIAGDFNLPDIDWLNIQTTNAKTASKHNKLFEILNEFGLNNIVNDPTRIESQNVLDLILTSNPSIVSNTHIASGMSDHEAVVFNINIRPITHNKKPHKVYKYGSADWDNMKSDCTKLTDHADEYFNRNPDTLDIKT